MRSLRLNTEFLIVGAGAAGCTLAWLLRQAGRDVLVIELHDTRSKDKLCGGALGDDGLRAIEDIFGKDALTELSPTYPPCLRSRCLDRETVCDLPFATLPRKRLDDWLLARCIAAGAEIRDLTRLESIDEKARMATCEDLRDNCSMQIGYDTLIGADGAASSVRRLLTGHGQRLAVAVEGTAPLAGDDIVLEYSPARLGYCWYIPTDTAANAGCMLYEGAAADCREWLGSFCGELGVPLSNLRGAPIPTGDDVLLRVGENAFLAGDAAGLVRPCDGGGISYALLSARNLASSLLGGTPYEEAMRPLVEDIARTAVKRKSWFFCTALQIASQGHAW